MPNKIAKKRRSRGPKSPGRELDRLVEIMARLRAPGGCPWDRKQTHKSLLPYLVEETYELKDALLSRSAGRMREEMGDLLLQIVFHAQLAAERGRFDMADVAQEISDKLIRRHPHVFGDDRTKLSANQVLENWERLKLAEKPKRKRTLLGGVPRTLPALLLAYRIQEKVAQFGFDWQRTEEVESKLREETDEFHRAFQRGDRQAVEEELGDLLFTLVNLARHVRVDPETALARSSRKFAERFEDVERRLRRKGTDPAAAGLDVLEREWQSVKADRRRRRRRKGTRRRPR